MSTSTHTLQTETWDLTDLYPSEADWKASKAALEQRLPQLAGYAGRLGESAAALKAALDLLYDMQRELYRLYTYTNLHSDEDTRNAGALELRQQMGLLGTEFSRASSFFRPELLETGPEKIEAFLNSEPGLEIYRFPLQDILRLREHTLGLEAESVLSATSLLSDAASSIYGILSNADIQWPEVELSDGARVRLDQAGYAKCRLLAGREDRKKTFETFWPVFKTYERTCGVALFSQIKTDLFYSKVRKYPGALASALASENIPEAVYRTLVSEANANLDTLHRYLRLRGRLLGLEDLHYYDLYAPLLALDKKFTSGDARELTLKATAPLGEAYSGDLRRGLYSRWMHTFPREGKRAGAYMSGSAYDVHPYVLMNFNENYESVSTLAHEWGHAMHSVLANRAQPFATSDYSIFTAEIASVLNEVLLLETMLEAADSDEERLYYLGSALEGMRSTFFRQTMFAEFELATHEAAEAGGALSGERFSAIYGEILRRYHGHDGGVMNIDPLYTVEWAFVPHFYRSFYVYQYATSMAAANAFADRILSGHPDAVETYLGLLRAGGSDYPYALVQAAGVDLATPAPYRSLVGRMNTIMDRIEAIVKKPNGEKPNGNP